MLTDKDKEAIAHIASVSKYPHAGKIAEWLITGADIEFKLAHRWIPVDYVTWRKDTEYRLVYPEIKPAYRVFRFKNSGNLHVYNSKDGERSDDISIDKEWITDWIEYDEPTSDKWPHEIIERIAEYDLDAAKWLKDR